jgi:hypothetical protein
MKRFITIAVLVAGVLGAAGVLWVAKAWTLKRTDEKVVKFNTDCDNLILGIQQYKEFVGTWHSHRQQRADREIAAGSN